MSRLFLAVFVLCPYNTNQQKVSAPLLDKMDAPLVAILDLTKIQKFIDDSISVKVKEVFDREIHSGLHQIITPLNSNITALKVKNKQLEAKLMKLEKDFEDLKKKPSPKQQRCQSGVFTQHSPTLKFPVEKRIKFSPPFEETPSFVYGITLIDMSSARNIRPVADFLNLTKDGVNLKLKTWADTIMYGLRISWMACPK